VAEKEALVTRHEAARFAGVTFNTILLWIRAGRLHPVAEPGRGRRVIRLSEVETVVIGSETAKHRTMNIWAVGAKTVRNAPPSLT
jgi:predicted site-specific integrase-resolvase